MTLVSGDKPGRLTALSLPKYILGLCLILAMSSCSSAASPDITPAVTPNPTVTPTAEVSFEVAVTPVAPYPHRRATPTPQPTRFAVPSGPYITLHPDSGPPADRMVRVIGGHFPVNSAVDILWSPTRKFTPLSTTGYADRSGNLRVSLFVPASATGDYRVVAQVQGSDMTSTLYHVVSLATLEATVSSDRGGSTLTVFGKRFIPNFHLILIAYSTVSGRNPTVLGKVQSDAHGSFQSSRTTEALQPGQYVLRAWSASSLAAQMAQTFFEVVM